MKTCLAALISGYQSGILIPYKTITCILLLVFTVCSYGRTQNKKEFIQHINNTKGDKHIKIAGTNVYLVPPTGFLMTATGESLFDPFSGARISVIQLQHPFSSALPQPAGTVGLIDQHLVRVNHYEGHYQSMQDDKDYIKEVLSFGNEKVTVKVKAQMPTNDSIINKVRTAIGSVILLDETLPDPSQDALFKVDTKKTNLKFARMINGMLIYTETGDMISSRIVFLVAFNATLTGTADMYERLSQKYLQQELYYRNVKIEESQPITIDGMSGYEITAEATHSRSNENEILYLVTLFTNHGAYTIVGTAGHPFEDNLTTFKQVARTFYVK